MDDRRHTKRSAAGQANPAVGRPSVQSVNKPQECERLLRVIAGRMETILLPANFRFQIGASGHSSTGPYATGSFSHSEMKIDLAYRWFGFGCVNYEVDSGSISHDDMMRSLGFGETYMLHYSPEDMISYGRNGEDAIDSLIHDLKEHFIPLFRQNRPFVLKCHKASFQNRTIETTRGG